MKKNGILRLLGMMSCVALLSSCGQNKAEDPKLVVKTLPETIHIGDVLDLDDFVKAEGTSKTFDVYLYKASREIASLSGHKITIKDEGEIKFKVSLGDYSQTISVNSLAEMRDYLASTFASYTGDYIVSGAVSQDIFIHKPQYAERIRTVYEGETPTSQLRDGYVSPEKSDAIYKFSVNASYEPSYADKIYAKSDMAKYYGSFGVNFSTATRGTTTVSGQKLETYQLKTMPFQDFVSNVLVSNYKAYKYYTTVDGEGNYDATSTTKGYVDIALTGVKFTVIEDDGKFPAALLFGKVGGKETMVDVLAFSNGNDATGVSDGVIDYYLDQGLDVGTDYPEQLKTFFLEGIAERKSYVATFQYGWVDANGESIAAPDTSGTIFDGVPNGKSTRVLSENAIVTIENDVIVEGVVQKDGTVYDVKFDGTTHVPSANPDYADVYEDRYHSLSFIGNDETWADDMLYVNEEKTTEENLVFGANLTRHYELIDSICSCEDNASKLIPILFKYESRDIKSFFNFDLSVRNSDGFISISYQLTWERGVYYKVGLAIQEDTEHAYDGLITDLFSELFH